MKVVGVIVWMASTGSARSFVDVRVRRCGTCAWLSGECHRLGLRVKPELTSPLSKLSAGGLRRLLHELHSFWNGLASAAAREDEAEARLWVVDALNKLPEDPKDARPSGESDALPVPPQDPSMKALTREVGEWLETYIE